MQDSSVLGLIPGLFFHELTSVALGLYDSGPIGVGCVMYSLDFLSKPEET